jgi:serine/threonine protein kinase
MGPAPAPSVQRLGRYEVIRHLASGGMAEIYLARHQVAPGKSEVVVIKLIATERGGDKKFIQMFLDEARVAATLHHPNIAQMLEVGRQDDTYFLAMEFVDGDTVRALLERSVLSRTKVPIPVCLHIIMAVAAGLHHAHERKGATGEVLQIVHRDVTPSNVMLGWDGSVKLLDFGIARANNRAAETQSGTIKGKFAYMSPEQCRGLPVDRRTDVFALGIVLYELTTLRRAFRTESDFETMDRIVKGRLTRPSAIDPTYPPELEAIVMKALATDAAVRYQSADELRRALEAYAKAHGATATAADVAAVMHARFRAGDDPMGKTIEETHSEIEVAIGTEPDAEVELEVDAGTTTRHRPAALDPAMTGPMPVMPSRPSSQVAIPALTGPRGDPHVTGPNPVLSALAGAPNVTGANPTVASAPGTASVTGATPAVPRTGETRIPADEWNAPVKTILGTGPISQIRAPTARPATAIPSGTSASAPARSSANDSATRRASASPSRDRDLPAAADFVAVNEPTHVRRAQRNGLRLALIAVVVVAALTAAVLALAGGGDAAGAIAPTTPSAPR